MSCGARPQPPVISWTAAYLRLSLSNTLGWLVAVPDVPEEPVEPAAVLRDRPRMKYQIRAARIARPRMIQSQEKPLPSSAGAGGEPGVAGGVAWARASFNAQSVMIVKTWSLLSIMFPFRPQGLRINVGHNPAFLSHRGLAPLALVFWPIVWCFY
jgi:hypothetical protein